VGENIFLNVVAECLLNFGLFYPQNYSWRIFRLKRDWRKSTKFIICNGLYVLN